MPQLAHLPCADRPQERLEQLGPASLRDGELLSLLLRSGSKGHDVLHVADELLKEAGSLQALSSWTASDFSKQKGIGRIKGL